MAESLENAKKCIEIARECHSDDIQKAIRFLRKSVTIHRTDEAERLLAEYEREARGESSAPRSAPTPTGGASSHTTASGSKTPFTSEQRESAIRIKKLKNHYEILGVKKTASERDIKLAYRKLAIKLHPDKNSAPEAEEAFKKLTAAHECLSNEEKRRRYDNYGDEDPGARVQDHAHHHRNGEVSPEDLFNMFFSNQGGGQQGRFYRFQYGGPRRGQQQQEGGGGGGGSFFSFIHFFAFITSYSLFFYVFSFY